MIKEDAVHDDFLDLSHNLTLGSYISHTCPPDLCIYFPQKKKAKRAPRAAVQLYITPDGTVK